MTNSITNKSKPRTRSGTVERNFNWGGGGGGGGAGGGGGGGGGWLEHSHWRQEFVGWRSEGILPPGHFEI